MATRKVTVTLQTAQLSEIQGLVAAGKLDSVSGFVQHAVSVSLADIAGWRALLTEALDATGGPLTRAERAWADEVLKKRAKRRRKGRAA
jgi:Arc/MetJ-type ribon-helix-helix transcriptional regulator